jgi:microcystin-dependent protein
VALILPNTLANEIPADGDKLQQNFATIEDYVNQDVITADGSTAMTAPLLLPGAPTQPNQAATKDYVDTNAGFIGEVKMYAPDTAPNANWMLCRGQAISRATYAALFGLIGIRFGAGDGSTTFNLPDYQGTYPVGFNNVAGGVFSSGVGQRAGSPNSTLPTHQHPGVDHLHGLGSTTGLEGVAHDHVMSWGEVWHATANPPDNVNVFAVRIGDGFTMNIEKFQSANFPSSVERQNHNHSVGGNTGAADRNLATGYTGVDPTNGNLPPSLSINFIMRVQ